MSRINGGAGWWKSLKSGSGEGPGRETGRGYSTHHQCADTINADDAIDEIERLLLKEVKRHKKMNRLSAANAEILRSHLTYIENNKKYMRYATLRKKGIPTGSGATEGA